MKQLTTAPQETTPSALIFDHPAQPMWHRHAFAPLSGTEEALLEERFGEGAAELFLAIKTVASMSAAHRQARELENRALLGSAISVTALE